MPLEFDTRRDSSQPHHIQRPEFEVMSFMYSYYTIKTAYDSEGHLHIFAG